jgi:hypothetical protein
MPKAAMSPAVTRILIDIVLLLLLDGAVDAGARTVSGAAPEASSAG